MPSVLHTFAATESRVRWRGGRKRLFSSAEEKTICTAYLSGKSVPELASENSCSNVTIYHTLSRGGVSLRPQAIRSSHPMWKGGITSQGAYMCERLDPKDPYFPMAGKDGTVLQHRVVMARHLGRILASTETVHHINGVTKDNRIENLELRHGRHGKGAVLTCSRCQSSNVIPVPLKGSGSSPVREDVFTRTSPEILLLAEERHAAGKPISIVARELGVYYRTLARDLVSRGVKVTLRKQNTGSNSVSWRGGRCFIKGYATIRVGPEHPFFVMAAGGKFVMEHRLVMAEHLGRPLRSQETVHHINGDRKDNRLVNLQLRNNRHGPNQSFVCAGCGSEDTSYREIGGST